MRVLSKAVGLKPCASSSSMPRPLGAIHSPPVGSKPFTSRSLMSRPLRPFIRHQWVTAPITSRSLVSRPVRPFIRCGLSFASGLKALHVKALEAIRQWAQSPSRAKALEAIHSPPVGSKSFTSSTLMPRPLRPFIRHQRAQSPSRLNPSCQGP